jgi:hypothetical protein
MRKKHSKARYEMLCGGCRESFVFWHTGPQLNKSVVAIREACPHCGRINYGSISGEDAYKPRQATLDLQWAILDVFAEIRPPMTVRQVYYQLSTRHAVEKTEAGYDKAQRNLTDMRRDGSIPYGYLADNSRSIYQVAQYSSVNDALHRMQQFYRRDLWETQNAHVEIWLEKRALVNQILPICQEYGVKLFPCGGYSSISFAYEAATEWGDPDKVVYIYHLSDFDADGAYSSVALERELREHSNAVVSFHRLALGPTDIARYNLLDSCRPQKTTSKRFPWWKENYGKDMLACELDALHPNDLRQIVRTAIERHIDKDELANIRRIEEVERQSLAEIAKTFKIG